ncbi:NADH oxidase [bacterium BMS3Abin05]|nr:NADH oxidase [bacterium BMS3Abin05]
MHISDKTALSGLYLKNRFFMAPVKTAMALPGGVVTQDSITFYERISQGGVAAIILEPTSVSAGGREHPKQLCIHEDGHINEIKKLAETIHKNGSLVGVHINHAGRAANPKVIGHAPVAPSPMLCPANGAESTEIPEEKIPEIIDDFGKAAHRAVKAGADFIEVQFGHGYLVSQFFSERTNKRNDQWGGSLEKRLRFGKSVLTSVLKNADDFPVIVRISGSEFVQDGISPENIGPLLELVESFDVAALHVGYGNACDNPPWYYNHMGMPEEEQSNVLRKIRSSVDLPVIAVGRMGYLPKIDHIFSEDLADYISLGRPLITDPEFPKKATTGREDEIVLCGGCLEGCLRAVKRGEKIQCIVNPDVTFPQPRKTKHPQKIMVVGAGPAGIAASIYLGKEGHEVSLYEKEKEIGGQFNFAPVAPFKKQMTRTLASMKKQIETVDVAVHTGTKVTAGFVKKENPQVLIVATGSQQNIPPIKNIEAQHVLTSIEFYARTKKVRGDRILVIGLGMVGLETVAILAETGKTLVGVDPLPEIAGDMEPMTRKMLLTRLSKEENVTLMSETAVKTMEKDGTLIEEKGQKKKIGTFDTVIIAAGMKPNDSLSHELEDWDGIFYTIGDAGHPANITAAFHSGQVVAEKIK